MFSGAKSAPVAEAVPWAKLGSITNLCSYFAWKNVRIEKMSPLYLPLTSWRDIFAMSCKIEDQHGAPHGPLVYWHDVA